MKTKVLNLYAGIGGNRKLWENVEVTAVEQNSKIAKIYSSLFPNDKIIIADAHDYLLKHFTEFDFIWSSPPCPSHSSIRKMGCYPTKEGKIFNTPIYPDMKLYEEILLLKYYFKGKWVVENVIPFYKPLIEAKKLQRHLFWCNFPLNEKRFEVDNTRNENLFNWAEKLGFGPFTLKLLENNFTHSELRTIYRNCVNSYLGKYVYDMAYHIKQNKIMSYV